MKVSKKNKTKITLKESDIKLCCNIFEKIAKPKAGFTPRVFTEEEVIFSKKLLEKIT